MKDDREYLNHILEALDDIERYASAGREAFLRETMRQDAVIRKLVRDAVARIAFHLPPPTRP